MRHPRTREGRQHRARGGEEDGAAPVAAASPCKCPPFPGYTSGTTPMGFGTPFNCMHQLSIPSQRTQTVQKHPLPQSRNTGPPGKDPDGEKGASRTHPPAARCSYRSDSSFIQAGIHLHVNEVESAPAPLGLWLGSLVREPLPEEAFHGGAGEGPASRQGRRAPRPSPWPGHPLLSCQRPWLCPSRGQGQDPLWPGTVLSS